MQFLLEDEMTNSSNAPLALTFYSKSLVSGLALYGGQECGCYQRRTEEKREYLAFHWLSADKLA
jgi:hypothetical protein